MEGYIFNIQKFCLHDGPGIRTTVFFKGCNLRCAWCANPESRETRCQLTLDRAKCLGCGKCAQACPADARRMQNGLPKVDPDGCTGCGECLQACPAGAIGSEGRRVSVAEVLPELMKDKVFYENSGGGVTLSGGDPLMQPAFAAALAGALHAQGVRVAVETAAAVPNADFLDFLRNMDYVFMDLKHYDGERHRLGTGVGNEQIIENMRSLRKSGLPFTIRIPVIPGYNDAIDDALGFAQLLADMQIRRVQLLPFHQLGQRKYELLGLDYAYSGVAQLHPEDLETYAKTFARFGVSAEF